MYQRGLPRDWKKRLVSALVEPEVERILLFGSRARGDAGPHSDLDLLIVRRTGERFLARIGAAYQRLANAAVHLGVDVDVLVYTPEEYQRMLDEGNPLVTRAQREGKVLYEKPVGRSRIPRRGFAGGFAARKPHSAFSPPPERGRGRGWGSMR